MIGKAGREGERERLGLAASRTTEESVDGDKDDREGREGGGEGEAGCVPDHGGKPCRGQGGMIGKAGREGERERLATSRAMEGSARRGATEG